MQLMHSKEAVSGDGCWGLAIAGASQGTELIRDDLKGYAHVGGKACLASPRFLAIAGKLHARASSKLMPAA